jgi:hypothetical protein
LAENELKGLFVAVFVFKEQAEEVIEGESVVNDIQPVLVLREASKEASIHGCHAILRFIAGESISSSSSIRNPKFEIVVYLFFSPAPVLPFSHACRLGREGEDEVDGGVRDFPHGAGVTEDDFMVGFHQLKDVIARSSPTFRGATKQSRCFSCWRHFVYMENSNCSMLIAK